MRIAAMGRLNVLMIVAVAFLHVEGLAAADGQPKHGGILKVGLRKDIANLNPLVDMRSTTGLVHTLVFEGLTDVNANLEIIPSLAESWTISKDGKEYVFRLRKGVLFHNGKELDAEDVKWSLEYIRDSKNRAYAHTSVSPIDSVGVSEKYSLRLRLKEPFTPLLAIGLSGSTVILPKNAVQAGETLAVPPPGTGPFQFVEWKRGSEMKLVAHKDYWARKGFPFLSELLLKPVPSADVRMISLRSGDLDLIEEVPYPLVNDIKSGKYPEVKLSAAPIAGFRLITINVEAPYFKDPRVRRAIAHAVDRKAYIDGAAFGHGAPAYQNYPKGWKWYFDDVKNIEMDLDKAKALLDEAGHPNGFKAILQARQGEEAENMMLQSQLKKIGIDLELQTMEFAQYLRNQYQGKFGMLISGSDVYADIDRSLYYNFRTEPQSGSRRTRNLTRYSNPELDRLLDKARTIPNSSERRALYRKATEILAHDSPQVNLAFITRFYGYRNHVKGFNTNANGDLAFPEGGLPVTWIEKGQE